MPRTEAVGSEPARRPFTIGYFARIAPEKGLHNLVDAYRILRQERGLPPSRLRAAGYMARRAAAVSRRARAQADRLGARRRVRVSRHRRSRGEGHDSFTTSIVLSVPTRLPRTEGTVLLEAMACGVPVVQPNHGAFPEMIEQTGGGLLVGVGAPATMSRTPSGALARSRRARPALGRRGADGVRAALHDRSHDRSHARGLSRAR